jgi:peptidoglycan/xylan/chitin deacetylase (PgdA/CDA1 family)/glycosyltransferase involved in cell wall biosynthesis
VTPGPETPRFSIVVPTYGRRDLLALNLPLLADVERPWPVELVVVVDGSSDGSRETAESVPLPFPKTVLFQANAGAAAARNAGAAAATGEFLLFLDDDMAADPGLLVEHDKVLRAGADAAVGHIPLHPDSPPTVLTAGVRRWAQRRRERLQQTEGPVALGDLLTGQLSVRSSTFWEVGGFDTQFNEGGTFGAEDTDFLYRLTTSGATLRPAPRAVSHQRYVVAPRQHLRQWHEGGRADALLISKHPELRTQLDTQHGAGSLGAGTLRLAVRHLGGATKWWEPWLVARAEAGHVDLFTQWGFGRARDAAYWAGRDEIDRARSFPRVPVLAYHAIEAVDDPAVGPWCVPPEELVAHLEALVGQGWHFIDSRVFLAAMEGGPLPPRPVLLTFDDGYASFASAAAPVLRRLGVPATVFLVSGLLGADNRWDVVRGAARLPLMDAATIRQLLGDGVSFGVHSRSHPHLVELGPRALRTELEVARRDLELAGAGPLPMFAYPYGEHSALVRRRARAAGYQVAFALEDGARFTDAYAYPRVEVRRSMTPEEVGTLLERSGARTGRRGLAREARALARVVLAARRRRPVAGPWPRE